jgi:hypothetical protein
MANLYEKDVAIVPIREAITDLWSGWKRTAIGNTNTSPSATVAVPVDDEDEWLNYDDIIGKDRLQLYEARASL